MIARLRGEVIDRTADSVVIDVQGVGYVVTVSKRASFMVGDAVDLHVHTHVREDTLQLFGFESGQEREIFHLLITVPSIGPVKAMGILETPAEEVVHMVVEGNARQIAKLPGIGKRTAERMVVDLRDKCRALAPSLGSAPTPSRPTTGQLQDDLVSALTNLGFKAAAAEREVIRSIEQLGAEAGLDRLLRHTLDQLRRR